ncbi:MAG: LysR family transcriptional regulator [Mesorhizobium sp.]|nr:MAG: LysR family transcriptional regulator [Mesorhizobium sp.]RWD99772.1 MAG: LysR family transcriptional regulator [Mesorhizobium sp.]TIS51922.1 MAG: LysR family transcriptional regulator [Mesorhizobium sp.]
MILGALRRETGDSQSHAVLSSENSSSLPYQSTKLNWDDLKYILAVARHGSLSAAARHLRTTQPTVGRRIAALESSLGVKLFRRLPGSLMLTEPGQAILAALERIEIEALAIERSVSGRDAGPTGVVRITAAEWFCARVLAPLCTELSDTYPDLSVELIGEPRPVNLARREADVAFRFVRFDQQEVIQTRLGGLGFGLYAAPEYIERCGTPEVDGGFRGHAIIAMRAEIGPIADLTWLGEVAHAAKIVLRTDSREAQARAALAGLGLACLPSLVGDGAAGLVRLKMPVPEREIWMGVHADARTTPRVQAAARVLAAGIRKLSAPWASVPNENA